MRGFWIALALSFSLVLCSTQCEKEPEPEELIPDANFLEVLLEHGIDIDYDGQISPSEAEKVIEIDISSRGITNLKGIEAFTNLEQLFCQDNNNLKALDVSHCPELQKLYCGNNQLESIDGSNSSKLQDLSCINNEISILDLSENLALTSLNCGYNQIYVLDISGNQGLGEGYWPPALDIRDMPGMEEVCVWTIPFPPEGMHVNKTGSPNAY